MCRKNITRIPLSWYRADPNHYWLKRVPLEWSGSLFDVLHLPFLLLCVLLPWRLPSLYASVREWVQKQFPNNSELLRHYVREEAKVRCYAD